MKKVALITGITGQDGSYLAEFLLKKAMLFMVSKEEVRFLILIESTTYTKILMLRIEI